MLTRERLGVWWRLFRPFTLTASIVPVIVGSGLAWTHHSAHLGLFFAMLIASMLIQSATNMFNEYFDYKRGLDDEHMVGIAGTIVRDGIDARIVLACGWGSILLALLLGVYICASTSWWLAIVGILCIAVGYFYSGGPKPLSYTPFGEIAAAIAMGPTIVLIAYYIQTSSISWRASVASIPIGLLIGAILLANNIRDMDQDKVGGRKTIAILLGRERGRLLFGSVFLVTYLLVLLLVILNQLTPWTLVVLLTVPSAYAVTRLYFKFTEPAKLHAAVKGTANLLFRFGVLMFAGMLVANLHL
ncbi:1,4-dihydroxy-2-naphthoate polyprenyltransferase [Alicyclobacillus tolerans]|uniref:1,4-dihydroxy-2-naphthoate octaprenyltransferase n=2 Tax=Alicyclobacillus tolerans TaxID=90970 RepID=A0A1M6JQI0_9BACL|nr:MULTISPECIES: 1,4-dihydroxy-2-naphthoate polyprenyltransferase [Alicyclobacillus]MDP9727428.1 1,4-dihydroxy-2-naphthoate octaprenyltransferase [Alicyclobacillus tengchongensis]QRF23152.1 1,4-dihydroxy-2-naphthoate polyprenyltransferase [Alicyclobacillus sp. TC]SHJ49025.1 1,4-dihydroxy-2-naphthoate prenyltransferase [Alicyclobacillus montanus]